MGVNLALLYAKKQRMAIPQMREDVGVYMSFWGFPVIIIASPKEKKR